MSGINGAAQAAPNPDEMVGIADAADELGISLSLFISMLADDGELLVIPGTEDERCGKVTKVPDLGVPLPLHVDDCGCRFIASPHPDIVPMDEAADADSAPVGTQPKPRKPRTEYGYAARYNEAGDVVGVGLRYEYADSLYGGRDFLPIAEAEQLRSEDPELFWKIIDNDE